MGDRDPPALNLTWLLKLRWGAIAAQLVVFFAGDRLMHVALPVAAILGVIGVQVASNVVGTLWVRRAKTVPELALVAVMALDSLLLTALLFLSGADSNPFAVLYLANIALAGILVRPRWTWALVALSLACFSLLFIFKSGGGAEPVEADPLEWQLREAWLAFGVTAGLLVYFLQRTHRMLRERERAMEVARQTLERREKLASLATLAAGAAHEVGSPLSTIALVATELERQLVRGTLGPETLADARLIRDEVERCRRILAQMASDSGTSQGEPLERVTLAALLDRAVAAEAEPGRVQVQVDPAVAQAEVSVPPRAMGQALHAVLKNALQASGDQPVTVKASADAGGLTIDVADRGPGMQPGILARAGEPFFTTKEPGHGMGLGLFLTRSVLEQLGGRLDLVSSPTNGTTARLVLPATARGS